MSQSFLPLLYQRIQPRTLKRASDLFCRSTSRNNTRLRDRKVSKIHSKMNPRRATQSIVIGIGPISNVDGRQTNLLWNNCKRYKNIKGSFLDLR